MQQFEEEPNDYEQAVDRLNVLQEFMVPEQRWAKWLARKRRVDVIDSDVRFTPQSYADNLPPSVHGAQIAYALSRRDWKKRLDQFDYFKLRKHYIEGATGFE